jgi:Type II CAAX prenyl endopeptidase Rce1-like
MFTVDFPVKRPFQWKVFLALVTLYFLGNLAGIPLLSKTNMPIEPVWQWGVLTLISALIIAMSLLMANRTSLGAPLLERQLSKEEIAKWLCTGLTLTTLLLVVGLPFSLITNLEVNSATYPFGWELLLASIKAGIVEEIFSRLFLVSLFVWIGRLINRDLEGRPTAGVYWMAILLVGLLFGWGHVDARLGNPTTTFWDYALIMVLNSGVGIYFGWLFWKLGLEWAMFAHFAYDAFVSLVLIPIYFLQNAIVWLVLLISLVIMSLTSIRYLVPRKPGG